MFVRGFLAVVIFFTPWCALAAGSQTYSTPGTYTFTVPSSYGSLTVQVWGGGGGGAIGVCNSDIDPCHNGVVGGGAGALSKFTASSTSIVQGNGGSGGSNVAVSGGTGSGGTTNITGASGAAPWGCQHGAGGAGTYGYGAGADGTDSSCDGGEGFVGGGGGGAGGYATKTYTSGQLPATVSVVVGYGGGSTNTYGRVAITWTDAPPTCSVWSDTNPIAYGSSTTLRWASSNATTMYVTNIGYVSANATSSTSVGPLSSTAYNGTAVNASGTTTCAFTLSVATPNNCSFNGATVNHGSSVTAYQASGVAAGNSCTSESRSCSNGTLSGSYQYASCTVAPTCSISVSPTSITQGQSTVITWSSSGATSCTPNNFSGSGTSGTASVSPSSNTTYTMSCSNAGGSTNCSGTGSGGIGALTTVTCTQSWSCSNQTIVQTNADCSTQNLSTCDSENGQFCSNGSSQCLALTVTGSLSASPRLIPSGRTSTISWSTTNASSCTVSGNGDTWHATSGSYTSSAITHRVTYTLVCDDGDADTTEDDFSTTIQPYVLPSWIEL